MFISTHYTLLILNGVGKSNEALSQDGKIAVASSVTVFIVTAISFFIVGFLCGHFLSKEEEAIFSSW